jgi:hypothetical protein
MPATFSREQSGFHSLGSLMLFPGHDMGDRSILEIELLGCEQAIEDGHGE